MAGYGWDYNRPEWNEGYRGRPGAYAGGRFGGGYYGAGERLGGGGYGADYYTGRGGYTGGGYTGGGYRGGFPPPRYGQEYFGTERPYRPSRYDLDLRDRMREGWQGVRRGVDRAFRGEGRDWGDRLQEGWDEARRGFRRAVRDQPWAGYGGFGRGYDRGW